MFFDYLSNTFGNPYYLLTRMDFQNDWRGNYKPKGTLHEVRTSPKIGRNQLCSCGSGLKYKKCCIG